MSIKGSARCRRLIASKRGMGKPSACALAMASRRVVSSWVMAVFNDSSAPGHLRPNTLHYYWQFANDRTC